MDESNYLPRYRNWPWYKETEFYNQIMKIVEYQYCKWYGSAWGVSHSDIRQLVEDIKTGKTTITKYKREFNESCIRQNMGLGPNDPIPETKRKVKLDKVSDEELLNECKKRNLI